jgi:hypothetical protein
VKNVAPVAIIVGAVVDWVATLTFTLPVILYATISRGLSRLPPAQMKPAITNAMQHGWLFVATVLIGTLCTIFGSYIAGVLAKRAQVLNGVLSALLLVLIGLLRSNSALPIWLRLLFLLVVTPLAGALGGYLAQLQARRSETPA